MDDAVLPPALVVDGWRPDGDALAALPASLCGCRVETPDAVESAAIALVLVGPAGEGQDRLSIWCGRRACRVFAASARFRASLLSDALAFGLAGYCLFDEIAFLLHRLDIHDCDSFWPSHAIVDALLSPYRRDDDESALTRREREVLALIGAGSRVADLADVLGISRHTAAGYVKALYRKLGVSDRASAARHALRLGLIS